MAENFCYNQNGINHILEQFGDAISNKQYKNRIPYDIYRKIKNGCQLIFISFDCGDVLVKNDDDVHDDGRFQSVHCHVHSTG